MLKLVLSTLAFILVLGSIGCKKTHNASSPLDFSYTGTLHVGYLVSFHSNAGAGVYLWTFGDGSKSTDPNPNHAYYSPSSFLVTLTIDNDSAKTITKTIVIGPAFDFTYSGIPAAGQALTFTSNVPAGNSFLWNFGDGSMSTDPSPSHIFSTNNSFDVSLMLNSDSGHVIKKSINVFANGVYLSLIGGTKTWRHIYTDAYPWPPYHTPHTLADTSMAINYIAPSTVSIGADTLVYSSSTQSDSVLIFNHYVPYSDIYTHLQFNHFTSTISYIRDIHISAGAGDATDEYSMP